MDSVSIVQIILCGFIALVAAIAASCALRYLSRRRS
jgi:hypothetical protein